ncbi:MAG: trimethylamine methyltransferase family protein [Dehalobacterium sp.]
MIKRRALAGQHFLTGCDLHFLSDDEIEIIHLGSLEVLEKSGVFVEHDQALNIFESSGAMVDRNKKIVKIPGYLVEECIRTCSPKVLIAGRDPKDDVYFESNRVHFCPFGIGVAVNDPFTGEYRKAVKEDVANAAKLCDALEEIDMLELVVTPSDVNPKTANLHIYEALITNSTKPCLTDPEPCLSPYIFRMAEVIAGGKENLKNRPPMCGIVCPQSPLMLHHNLCEGIIQYARRELPMVMEPMTMAGATSPVTLAGTLVAHNAEVLACLTLAQLTQKGTPVIYGCTSTIFDMKTVTSSVGCPEISMIAASIVKLAQHYKIPTWVAGGLTDSKLNDMQAGHEKTLTALLPALAGANMIYGFGMLDIGLTFDFSSLTADNEFIKMIRRILEGIPVNDKSLAVDVIKEVGAMGNYLQHDHTLEGFKTEQSRAKLLDRRNREQWKNSGATDLTTRIEEETRQILTTHQPEPLPESTAQELRKIIEEAESELLG